MNPSFASSASAKIGLKPLWPLLIYGLAFVLTTVMYLLRLALPVPLGDRLMSILFMLPILVTALLGGFRPGLFATAIAAACTALLIPPSNSFEIADGHDLLQWGVLIINGIFVSSMSGLLHRSKLSVARKTNNNGQLQHFIVLSRDITNRTATEAALLQQIQELAERNAELQCFNRAMVGRELSMIKLKKEVNALSQQLGLKLPYQLDFLDAVPQVPTPTSPS